MAESAPAWGEQVAIVTGGARGLGQALGQAFKAKGATVVVFDLDEASADDGVDSRRVDMTDADAVGAAVAAVVSDHGRIDILVNAAGIVGKTNIKSHEVDLDDFDRVMNVNLRGPLLATRAVLPAMLSRDYGRILHIASISGKEGNAGMLAYSTSKAALIGMTKVQGKEYAETGITINALAPAVVRTEMVAAMPPEQVKYMTDKIPMKRCGQLAEVAAAGTFIVSPENSFTTGFTYDLSGGRATY